LHTDDYLIYDTWGLELTDGSMVLFLDGAR